MDRLVKPDVQELNLLFIKGQKCCANFKLTNLMHTMSVAISLTTTNPSLFSFSQAFSIIPPLSTSSYTLFLSQTDGDHKPPLSATLDTILVRSSMLPTGKAHQDDLRRLFAKPGLHIFKDATIPISFVGPDVVEFLISYQSRSLEINFLLPKAVSWCDRSQLSSLLRHAAKIGNSYFVSALIEGGADVNSRGADRLSAMSKAIKSGNIEVVQVLIESGYVINMKFDRFLHDATAMDRVDIIDILILGYADIDLNLVDPQGQTALHIAAIHGHVQALDFLVSAGSDPDIADCNGWTPLHFAANRGHIEAVEVLLTNSSFAKYAITKEGKTAFALAVEKGHKHLYDLLHLGDVLHRAARIGDVHSMKSCLAEGANINGRDQNGWTALHRAAFKGEIECVELLVSHGGEIDAVDDDGYTPLHLAIEAGHSQVALYLISHGAKANVKSLKGKIPQSDWNCFKNHCCSVVKPLCHEEGL